MICPINIAHCPTALTLFNWLNLHNSFSSLLKTPQIPMSKFFFFTDKNFKVKKTHSVMDSYLFPKQGRLDWVSKGRLRDQNTFSRASTSLNLF